ncbi:hypothetical protein CONLIGDRAFT_249549 [Coniochaeta ligniaria NRRL 30616]|uniref:Uncharacterized protein n=1 Tax=Coniochaeta ligniaria NRRL 30616 TaxID=1408157 RepID=A0A1J7IXH1_9PEZI|nr:hypothetical protein CONLIGDRAFT_249549 [Coniochaeta ligniaria NRRL 30616]
MQEESVHPTLQAAGARAGAPSDHTPNHHQLKSYRGSQYQHSYPFRPESTPPPYIHSQSERATTTRTPPPEYEDKPAQGSLDAGAAAFEQMVVARLERLEADRDRIEAAVLGLQQQQQSETCRRTPGGRRSLRRCCRRLWNVLVDGTVRFINLVGAYMELLGAYMELLGAYIKLLAAKGLRLSAWMIEFRFDPDHTPPSERNRAKAAEARRDADEGEASARRCIESHRNGTSRTCGQTSSGRGSRRRSR